MVADVAYITCLGKEGLVRKYKFRLNSDLCLTGYLRQILPSVITYGIQFDLGGGPLRRRTIRNKDIWSIAGGYMR